MASASGVIQSVRRDRKGIKIDDVWYSAYNPSELGEAQRGDTVTVEYKPKGDFKNIVSVTVDAAAPKGGGGGGRGGGYSGGGDKQFRSVPELNRIDALNAAVAVTAGDTDTKERVKHVLKLVPVFVNVIENGAGGGAAAPAKSDTGDDAAAKAEAEAKRKAEEEARKKAEAEAAAAAAAQKEAASSALDDFLND
jgi:hypothetical protein